MAGPYTADDLMVLSSSDGDEPPPKRLTPRPSPVTARRGFAGVKASPRKSTGGKAREPIPSTATIIDLSITDSGDSDVDPLATSSSKWKGKGKAEPSRPRTSDVSGKSGSASDDYLVPDEGISKFLESLSPPEEGSPPSASQSRVGALLAKWKARTSPVKSTLPVKEVKVEQSPVRQVLSPDKVAAGRRDAGRRDAGRQTAPASVSYAPQLEADLGLTPLPRSLPTWATEPARRPVWATAPAASTTFSSASQAGPMSVDVDVALRAPQIAAPEPQTYSKPPLAQLPQIPFPLPAIPFPPLPSRVSRSPEKKPAITPLLSPKTLSPAPTAMNNGFHPQPPVAPSPVLPATGKNLPADLVAPAYSSSTSAVPPPNSIPSSSSLPRSRSTSVDSTRPARPPSGPLPHPSVSATPLGVRSRPSSSSSSSASRHKFKANPDKKAAHRVKPEKTKSSWTNQEKFEMAPRPPPPPEAAGFRESPVPARLKMRHAPQVKVVTPEEAPRRHSCASSKTAPRGDTAPRAFLPVLAQSLQSGPRSKVKKSKGKRSPSPGSGSPESTPSREVKKRMKSEAREISVVPEVSPQVVNGMGSNTVGVKSMVEAQRLAPQWRTGADAALAGITGQGKGKEAQQEEGVQMSSRSRTPPSLHSSDKGSANGGVPPRSLGDLALQTDGVLDGSDLEQGSEKERLDEAVEGVRLGVDEVAIVAEKDDSTESSSMDVDVPRASVRRRRVVLSSDDEYIVSSAPKPATARKHTRRRVVPSFHSSSSESDQPLSVIARPPVKLTRTAEQWRQAVLQSGQTDSDVSQALDDDIPSGTGASDGRGTGSASVTDTRVYTIIDPLPKPSHVDVFKTHRGHIAAHQTLHDSPPPPDRVGTAIRVHSTAMLDAWNRLKDKLTPNPSLHRAIFESYIEESTQDRPIPDGLRLLNDIDDETEPPDFEFQYSHETLYNDAVPDPELSLGCGCEGPCDPKSTTCSCLKRQELYWYDTGITGFAYDEQGRIKPANCPIWECGETCGCPPECMNRVIQRGRAPETQLDLFKTKHKGWGVRARTDIAESTFVGIYSGELISEPESERRGHIYAELKRTYLFDCDGYSISNPPEGLEKIDKRAAELARNAQRRAEADGGELTYTAYSVDAFHYGFTRYFNHSCDPNLLIAQAYVKDFHPERPILVIFTRRDIRAGDELCISYKGPPDDPVYEVPIVKRKGKWDTKSKKKSNGLSKDDLAAIEKNGRCMCGTAACDGVMFT